MFWLSDFEDPIDAKDFQALGRRHDLTAILLRDPRDESLPPVGWVEIEDLERGERRLVNTSSKSTRAKYEQEARERRMRAEQALALARCPLLEIRTDRSYLPVLLRYFSARRRGRRVA
jgi:uncharacterized protein (DUF58 family)